MAETQVSQSRASAATTATHRKLASVVNILFISLEQFWGSSLTSLGMIVEVLQLYSLFVNRAQFYGPTLKSIGIPLYFTILPLWDSSSLMGVSYESFQGLIWSFIGVLLILSGMLCFLMWQVYRQQGKHGLTLFVAATNLVGSGVLFQPFVHGFLADTVCSNGYFSAFPSTACWDSSFSIVHFVVSLVGIALLMWLHFLSTFVIFADLPRTTEIKARPHALCDAVESSAKLLIIVLYHNMRNDFQAFAALTCAFSAIVVAVHAVILPYYHQGTTQWKCATWASLGALSLVNAVLSSGTGTPLHDPNSDWDFALVLAAMILAGAIGFLVANLRVSTISTRTVDAISRGIFVSKSDAPYEFPENLPWYEHPEFRQLDGTLLGEMALSIRTMAEEDAEAATLMSSTPVYSFINSILFESDVEVSTRFLSRFSHACQTAAPPAPWIAFAARIYSKGMTKYPTSLDIKFDYATFLGSFCPARIDLALRLVESYQSLPGVTWIQSVRAQRRSTQLSSAMNLRDASHKNLLNSALRLHREALTSMSYFWGKLQAEQVDMMRLAELAKSITDVREQGTMYFERVVSEANDTFALIRYSRFLEQIMMDTDSAENAREAAIELLKEDAGNFSNSSKSNRRKKVTATRASEKSESTSGTTSETIQQGLTLVFATLALLTIGLLVYGILMYSERDAHVKKVSEAGKVRNLAQEAGNMVLTIQRLGEELLPATTPPTALQEAFSALRQLTSDFRQHFGLLTIGNQQVDVNVVSKQWTSVTADANGTLQTASPWRVVDLLISIFETLSAANPLQTLSSQFPQEMIMLQDNLLDSVTTTLNQTAYAIQAQSDDLVSRARLALSLFFAFAVAIIATIHISMTVGFQKVNRSKLLTLNLFTLIPKVTLEKLEGENNQRITDFDAPDPKFQEMKAALGLLDFEDEQKALTNPDTGKLVEEVEESDAEVSDGFMQSKFLAMAKNAERADIGRGKTFDRDGNETQNVAQVNSMANPDVAIIADEAKDIVAATDATPQSEETEEKQVSKQQDRQTNIIRGFSLILLVVTGVAISILAINLSRDSTESLHVRLDENYRGLTASLYEAGRERLAVHQLFLMSANFPSKLPQYLIAAGVLEAQSRRADLLLELDPGSIFGERLQKSQRSWMSLLQLQRLAIGLSCTWCDEALFTQAVASTDTNSSINNSTMLQVVRSKIYAELLNSAVWDLGAATEVLLSERDQSSHQLFSNDATRSQALVGLSWTMLILGATLLLFISRLSRTLLPLVGLQFFLSIAVVALSMSSWDAVAVENQFNRRIQLLQGFNETTSLVRLSAIAAQEVVILGSPTAQLQFSALLQEDLLPSHLLDAFSSTQAIKATEIVQVFLETREWERIVVRLGSAYHQLPDVSILNAPWDASQDVAAARLRLIYPDQTWYSDDITDLQKASQSLDLALAMISGSIMSKRLDASLSRFQDLIDGVADESDTNTNQILSHESTLRQALNAVVGTNVGILCLMLLLLTHAAINENLSHGRKGEETQSSDDQLSALSRRSQAGMLVLAAIILIIYLVAFFDMSSVTLSATSQNTGSARAEALSKTLHLLQQTESTASTSFEVFQSKEISGSNQENTQTFLFGSPGGLGVAMRYSDVRSPLFGTSDEQQRSRFQCSATSRYVQAPKDTTGSIAFALDRAVEVSARIWQDMVSIFLFQSISERESMIPTVEAATKNVTTQLGNIQSKLTDDLLQEVNQNRIVFIVLMSLLLLAIFLEYGFVYRPMVKILFKEEAGTKLMLRMIPPDVRDSVPAIAEYLATGIVSADMKLVEINEAAANLSTLPVIMIDSKGTIEKFSKAAEEAFQWSRSEVLGRNVSMLMPENVAVDHDAYLRRYNRTGVQKVLKKPTKVRALRKDRTLFPAELVVREHKIDGRTVFVGSIRNISVDMEFERATVLSKAVSEAATVPIVVINMEGIVLRFNTAAENTFKYQGRDIVGKKVNNLMPPEEAEVHDRYLAAYKKTGVKHVIDSCRQLQAKKSNGELFHAQLQVRELVQPEGSVFIGYVEDLTKKIEFTLATRVNEAIASTSPVPVIEIDEVGTVVGWSPSASATFQIPATEMIGRNIKMVMPPSIAQKHDGYLASYLKNGRKKMLDAGPVNQRACRREDNGTFSTFPIRITVRELQRKGRGNTYIAYLQDTTQELELAHEQNIANSLSNLSLLGIVTITDNGTVVSFSRAAKELFGYPSEEVVGKNVKMLMPTEIASHHDEYLATYKQTKVKSVIGTSRRVTGKTAAGKPIKIVLNVTEVVHDETTLYVAYIRDVTSELEMEAANIINDSVFELSTTPILVMTQTGIITACSEAACNTFLWTRDEIVGQNVKLLMPDSYAKEHDKFLQRYAQKLNESTPEAVREASTVLGKSRRVTAKTRDDTEFPAMLYAKDIHIEGQAPFFVGVIRNVEEELYLESQRNISDAIIEGSSIPLICIDPVGTITVFSRAASDVFGYSKAEVIGKNVKMLQTEDIARAHDGYLKAYAKTGVKKIVGGARVAPARRKDGTIINVELRVEELTRMDQNGEVQKEYVSFVRDLTQEYILSQANMINSVVYQLTSVPIISIDANGIILEINDAAVREFGYSQTEAVGANVKILMPERIAVNHDAYLQAYKKTKVKHVIDNPTAQTGVRKDGTVIPVELLVREMKLENGESHFIAYCQNISSRKLDVQRHITNQLVLDLSVNPLIVADEVGKITHFTASACAAFGYTAEEVIGKNLKMLMPKEVAAVHDGYLEAYKKTRIKHVIDSNRLVSALKKNGDLFFAKLSLKEVLDAHGKSTYVGTLENLQDQVELSNRKGLLEAVFDVTPTPTLQVTHRGVIRKWSKHAEKCFGFKEGDVVGHPIGVLQPSELTPLDDRLGDISALASTTRREVKAKTKDGTILRCTLAATPAGNDSYIVHLWSIEASIENTRVAAEGKALIKLSPVPIVMISSRGVILELNNAFVEAFGYTEAELVDRNIKMLMKPDVARNHDSYLQRYQDTKVPKILNKPQIVQAVRKDGKTRQAELLVCETAVQGLESNFIGYLRDITAEQTFLKEHQVQDAMNDLSPLPFVAIDPVGTILKFPRSSEIMFGYSAAEVLGQNIKMLTPPAIAQQHDFFLRRYITTRKKIIVDSSRVVSGRKKNGEEVETELCLREVLDDNGDPVMFIGYFRPISNVLDYGFAEELNSTLMEETPDGVIIISDIGTIEEINSAAIQLFGLKDKSQAIGSNIRQYMPEEISQNHDMYLRRYKETRVKTIIDTYRKVPIKRPDGKIIQGEIAVKELLSKGKPSRYLGYIREITTRLEHEHACSVGDVAVDLSTSAVIVIDQSGNVLTFSTVAEEYWGYTAADILGKNVKVLLPDDVASRHDGYLSAYRQSREARILNTNRTVSAKHRSGQQFSIQLLVKELTVEGKQVFVAWVRKPDAA